MTLHQTVDAAGTTPPSARDWVMILAKYRDPDLMRSLREIILTLVPFLAIWAAAWAALSVSYVLALALAVVNAFFLVRIFAIQHDCGHSAFFRNKRLGDWVGRALGVLTLTPYDTWRRAHSIHHASSGNLDKRGMGDINTLTVEEYRDAGFWTRLMYRLYRNPLVMFGIGPIYIFLLTNRLPFGFWNNRLFWASTMGSNVFLLAILAAVYVFGGWAPILLIFLPTSILAGSIGIWLFYVQHQFEEGHWDHEPEWQVHDAAFHGSSHYVLPGVFQWLTANIGIHHVHHLYARIPFYRLPEVLRDHPALDQAQRLTFRESLACLKLHLWDEAERRMLTWREARDKYQPA